MECPEKPGAVGLVCRNTPWPPNESPSVLAMAVHERAPHRITPGAIAGQPGVIAPSRSERGSVGCRLDTGEPRPAENATSPPLFAWLVVLGGSHSAPLEMDGPRLGREKYEGTGTGPVKPGVAVALSLSWLLGAEPRCVIGVLNGWAATGEPGERPSISRLPDDWWGPCSTAGTDAE